MKSLQAVFLASLLILFPLSGLKALDATARHLKVVETSDARAPEIINNTIFFSFKPVGTHVRYAGIAFAHEDFRKVHVFERNEHGVLFYFYPIPEGISRLDYRLVIDGLWTADPKNPQKIRSAEGLTLSRFDIPPVAGNPFLRSPIAGKNGSVEFNFTAPAGREIYLCGSFNGWDPYMYRLSEIRPGQYSFTLRLLPGTYYYIFKSGSSKYIDSLNPLRAHNSDGHEISVLSVPP